MSEAETVVGTAHGERYHRAEPDNAFSTGVCGGFGKYNVVEFSPWVAEENGYTPCRNCYQCRMPDCRELQEFPHGPSEFCLEHALGMYFYWRPLAEFGPIEDTVVADVGPEEGAD